MTRAPALGRPQVGPVGCGGALTIAGCVRHPISLVWSRLSQLSLHGRHRTKGNNAMTLMRNGTLRASNLRDARYGTIFLITGHGNHLKAAVYSTFGLNDCPLDKWRSLDAERLAKEFRVAAVYLSGPRFCTFDQGIAYMVGETLSFQGLEARQVGEMYIPPTNDLTSIDLTSHETGWYYSAFMVRQRRRDIGFLFEAGRPVHELLTPDEKTYVMQSYSHSVDDSLTGESLLTLGNRLTLPDGWQYRVRVPDQYLVVRPGAGQTELLWDELENVYI